MLRDRLFNTEVGYSSLLVKLVRILKPDMVLNTCVQTRCRHKTELASPQNCLSTSPVTGLRTLAPLLA